MKQATLRPIALAAAKLALRGAIGALVALAFLVTDLPCLVESLAETVAESAGSAEVAKQCEARPRVRAPRQPRERSSALSAPDRPRRLPPASLLAATTSTRPAPSASPVPLRC